LTLYITQYFIRSFHLVSSYNTETRSDDPGWGIRCRNYRYII